MSAFGNIHKLASSLIPQQNIEWRKAATSTVDQYGQVTSTYANQNAWNTARAHVQPGIVSSFGGKNISEKDYKEMGLDWSRRYVTIWVSDANITSVAGAQSTDQIRIGGNRIFNVIQVADWIEYNGWKRCYCVEVLA